MNNKLNDKSGDKKYFIQIPQLILVKSRNAHDFVLWSAIKMVAGEEGECYLSTNDLATLCGISAGQVSKSRKYWIDEELLKGKFTRDPGYPQPVWHIEIPDIWQENIRWRTKFESLKSRIEYKGNIVKEYKKELEKNKKNPHNATVEPSLSDGGVTSGDGGVTSGETKKNQKEEPNKEPNKEPTLATPEIVENSQIADEQSAPSIPAIDTQPATDEQPEPVSLEEYFGPVPPDREKFGTSIDTNSNDKGNILTWGRATETKLQQAEQQFIDTGWNIRDTTIRHVASIFMATTKLQPPADDTTRKYWYKTFKRHSQNFTLDNLWSLYEQSYTKLTNSNMDIGSPDSLTKTMFAIQARKNTKSNADVLPVNSSGW